MYTLGNIFFLWVMERDGYYSLHLCQDLGILSVHEPESAKKGFLVNNRIYVNKHI